MNSVLKTIFVTGGAGFIGSALVRHLVRQGGYRVVNIDKLTYAAQPASLADVADNPRYVFEQHDILDATALHALFARYQPLGVIHLAAESHVDRSIDGPRQFIDTNMVGTYTLLDSTRTYWMSCDAERQAAFRFHHVSTDEVYGALGEEGTFSENSPYRPNSPYAASKAASDHLVRAWHHTYGLPVLVTNCSNNYGPCQFPEKLIPLTILNALHGQPLPVYGDGLQVRDWLFVDDHVKALQIVFEQGVIGQDYNIGGGAERRNIDVVEAICDVLETIAPQKPANISHYRQLIQPVADRPGHDFRYAINAAKIAQSLGWQPQESFDSGLRKTVIWYLQNPSWWQPLRRERYQGQRLGQT